VTEFIHITTPFSERNLCGSFRIEAGRLTQRIVMHHRVCGREETFAMKSALSIIAFSKSDPTQAIVSLLEVALEAACHALPAAYADMVLNTFLAQRLDKQAHGFELAKRCNKG
jgi:hypothetical protein